MLVSLDPDRMAHLGLDGDRRDQRRSTNRTRPTRRDASDASRRRRGRSSRSRSRPSGRLSTPEEFANIILRARPDGSVLHVRDVGTVTLGSQSYDNVIRLNGKPTGGLIVFLRAGANALEAKDGVVARMDELAETLPARGALGRSGST